MEDFGSQLIILPSCSYFNNAVMGVFSWTELSKENFLLQSSFPEFTLQHQTRHSGMVPSFVFLLRAIWQLHLKPASVSGFLKNYIYTISCNHLCCNLHHRWYCTKKSDLSPVRPCHICFINIDFYMKKTIPSLCAWYLTEIHSQQNRDVINMRK